MKIKYIARIIGMLLFLVGAILGMLLFGFVAWANLEANYYGFEDMGGGHLTSVKCPNILSTSDLGVVGATFNNPSNNPVDFMVRADISNRGVYRQVPKMIHLDPHKSVNVEWNVSSADVNLRNFIFVQIVNFPYTKYGFRQGICGIVVLNIPGLTGSQLFTLVMITILGGILGGIFIWEGSGKPFDGKLPEITRAMKVLGVLVLVGMLFSFAGSWLLAMVTFAISVLAIGVILGFTLAE